MRQLKNLLFSLMMVVLFALPAHATEFIDMDICIGKKILARSLCKTPAEVNYVARVKENVYLFSVFYAKTEARFFVGVYKDIIRIQGKDFITVTRTIPYHFDAAAKCSIIDYSVPDCPTTERLVCCSEKTIEEKRDDTFWDKTIPELLEEDLENALKSGNPEPTEDEPAEGKQTP